MKQCPTCQSQYTDDTLKFCLQDGTPLSFVAGEPTGNYGEQETVVSHRPSSQNVAAPPTNPTAWTPNQYQTNPGRETAEKKSGAPTAVFLTAFVMLVLFGIVGIGAWLYFRGATPDKNTDNLLAKKTPDRETAANTASTAPAKPTPAATVANANTTTTATNTAPPVDREKVKQEVSERLDSWATALEGRNLGNYMSNYAPTVDYYNRRGASVASVRADKEKAFTSYDSMQMEISNLNVTTDASGNEATAVFDKEWSFEGERPSAGKVQSQLKLKKINGQWLITAERDLKVY